MSLTGPVRGTIFLIGILSLFSRSTGIAEVNRWSAIGPAGYAAATHLAADPTRRGVVFAAASDFPVSFGFAGGTDKLLKTSDGGKSWSVVLGPDYSRYVPRSLQAVAVAATSPSTIYVSDYFTGLLRSADGQTWVKIGFGGGPTVLSLAADPLISTTIYAGTTAGVYKSLDSGESWTQNNNGLEGAAISLLAIDPRGPNTVYAGSSDLSASDGRLFKSVDGGSSWFRIDGGLKGPEDRRAVLALAIDPESPQTIYAGKLSAFTNAIPQGGGLFRSRDGGLSWEQVASAADFRLAKVYALAVSPTSPATVYAGTSGSSAQGALYVSRDGGATWDRTASDLSPSVSSLAVDPFDATSVLAGVSPVDSHLGVGILKTADSGREWFEVENGIGGLSVLSLAVSPSAPRVVFAAANAGIFRSTDAGATWERFSAGGLDFGGVATVSLDPTTSDSVYVINSGAIFKSANGGGWTQLNRDFSASAIVIDPAVTSTLYAGARDLGGTLGPGVYRSSDGGQTWEKRSAGLPLSSINTFAVSPSSSSTIYAAAQLNGLYRSTDAGLTWTSAGAGVPRNINALAIDPGSPSIIYAGADTGLFRSADGGATWSGASPAGLQNIVSAVSIDPGNPLTVYAATCTGVFRSTDRGLTWGPIGGGPCVQSLAIDPASDTTLYAGTLSSGVWSITFLSRTVESPQPRILPFRR